MTCEAFCDDGSGGCLWCPAPKNKHAAGQCLACDGYGYRFASGTSAAETLRVPLDDEPVLCGRCQGAGIVDREGRPMFFNKKAA